MNFQRILYWVATAIMLALFTFSAFMYFTKYEMVTGFFEQLGFPVWMIYPLAILKVLGVVAVLSAASKFLMEWAYAGFFFDACAAIAAHLMAGHGVGGSAMAIMALVAVIVSRALLVHRSKTPAS